MRDFSSHLITFKDYPQIASCIEEVLGQLPDEVQDEFFSDPHFRISLDDYVPGKGRTVLMADLGPEGASRCVVLKPKLENCSLPFTRYIVAHELAHSYLHNGGWGEISDREEAADALAASWGIAKVPWEW